MEKDLKQPNFDPCSERLVDFQNVVKASLAAAGREWMSAEPKQTV